MNQGHARAWGRAGNFVPRATQPRGDLAGLPAKRLLSLTVRAAMAQLTQRQRRNPLAKTYSTRNAGHVVHLIAREYPSAKKIKCRARSSNAADVSVLLNADSILFKNL